MHRPSNLPAGSLSQIEAIGQSLANIAPTATPAMGIPFILAISGNGSWLACLLAMLAIACVTRQINFFARRSSSAGSLYCFVEEGLGLNASLVAAWAMLIAYIGTGCAVVGGFSIYTYALLGSRLQASAAVTILFAIVAVGVAAFLAYRDVHISARVMLVIEAISIALIMVLFLLPGTRTAVHFDHAQILLQGTSWAHVRGGLVLAIFGFVGFESAASLGNEVKEPLKNIPRAITLTAWISGIFFVVAAYAECIGFAGHANQLAQTGAPLELLANLRNMPRLAPFLAATTVCSFFACTLACITAAARIVHKLAEDRHLHSVCCRTHAQHRTPHVAIFGTSAIILFGVVLMAACRVIPFDIYGWSGTFATYGFITAYFLVCIGAAVSMYRARSAGALDILSLLISLLILGLSAASAFDSDEGVYHRLPYLYLAGLLAILPVLWLRRHTITPLADDEQEAPANV